MKFPLLLASVVLFATTAHALTFVAYGDSRSNPASHKTVVDAFATENPALVLHTGDLWEFYAGNPQAVWMSHINGNPVLKALLDSNAYLVSRGNHETWAELSAVTPTLVRNNSETYSFTQGNCFFVSLGFDPGLQGDYLEQELSSQAAQAAKWIFVYSHKPMYSSGSHGANGDTSEGTPITRIRQLCDTYHVTAWFSGHDHVYERTWGMFANAAVAKTSTINTAQTPSTVYFVTGGGGAPLYASGSHFWTAATQSTLHYCLVTTTDSTCSISAKTPTGVQIDNVLITRSSPSTIDVTPPVISSISPVNTQAVSVDSTMYLTLATDENATVRWSMVNQPFDSMPNMFTTGEGGLDHATTTKGIPGTTYTIYFRAKDTAGNVDTVSDSTTFTYELTNSAKRHGSIDPETWFSLSHSNGSHIEVRFNRPTESNDMHFEIIDMSGRKFKTVRPPGRSVGFSSVSISTSDIPAGMYVVACFSGKNRIAAFTVETAR